MSFYLLGKGTDENKGRYLLRVTPLDDQELEYENDDKYSFFHIDAIIYTDFRDDANNKILRFTKMDNGYYGWSYSSDDIHPVIGAVYNEDDYIAELETDKDALLWMKLN